MQNDTPTLGFFKKRKFKQFYKNFVGEADTVFVFGDQTGTLTQLFTELKVKVVCIQPIPTFIPALKEKFAKNQYCYLVHEDVGAFQTEFYYHGLYERQILPYSSNLSASEAQEYIKITTLDDLINRYGIPSYCYIAAEGFEGDVLKGLSHLINTISFTFYSFTHEKTTEIVRRIMSLGEYEFNWKFHDTTKLISKNWLSPKSLHYSIQEHSDTNFGGEIFARLITKEDTF